MTTHEVTGTGTAAATLIEAVLAGEIGTEESLDEAAWHRLWERDGLAGKTPLDMALAGGALADRLSWVFVSGYQAALHANFPQLPTSGWAAFVATEDRQDPAAHPGTFLASGTRGRVLHGYKSWVAQSRQVAHLLVTAREHPEDDAPGCVLVSAHAPGVHLSHRDEPGFLADMSQGFARFDSVEVAGEKYGFERSRAFGRSESIYVMLAASAFLLAQQAQTTKVDDELVALSLALAAVVSRIADEGGGPAPARVLAALDRSLAACVARFDHLGSSVVPSWGTDRRLLGMYSNRIQRRAARATGERGNGDTR